MHFPHFIYDSSTTHNYFPKQHLQIFNGYVYSIHCAVGTELSRDNNVNKCIKFHKYHFTEPANFKVLSTVFLRRKCVLKHVTEGKIYEPGRRGRRSKQLQDERKQTERQWKLEDKVLYRTQSRTRFGKGFGPVVRQTT